MKALLVVDAQNDFMPGGSLAVPNGDKIVPYINNIRNNYGMVIWTKDWHPRNHCSFTENNGVWPVHCVQMSKGAQIHKNLEIGPGEYTVLKGKDKDHDSYSAFMDDGGSHTGLCDLLRIKGIQELDICGLSTEYCVKFTVLDALKLGFKANLLTVGCRGIDSKDCQEAIAEMKDAGANIV